MLSFSVCRGQSDQGVGEGPGLEVEHGEQYLAADGPLYDRQLLAAIRPWMTLDLDPLDDRALGESLEAWSCFSEGGFSFVVRLTPAGKYDQRTAYFAHGRAWPETVWDEGQDAAFSLGDAAAFDPPWRGKERPQAFEPPEDRLAGIEKVQAAPQVAVQLLGHLLEASLQQRPLLMAVPLEDFRRAGSLVASIALARAALPFPVKRLCRIRLYTRRPGFFLQDAGARLVVVPQDEAESVRSLRGLTLLNREAGVEGGRQASRQAMDYAQRVVELVCRRPQSLFDFSRRIGGLVHNSESLSSLDSNQLPRIYQISATTAQQLEQSVLLALKAPQDFPWGLLRDDDLGKLSANALVEILLTLDPSGGRLSGFQQRTRRLMAADEFSDSLRRQAGELLESEWPAWNPDGTSPQSLEKLSQLAGLGLVSDGFAASQSSIAPLQAVAALADPAPLLEAELRSGQLQRRRLGNPDLTRLAARPSLTGVLAEGVLRQVLPSGWLGGWLGQASHSALTAFALRFVGHPEAPRHRRDHYPALLERLLEQDSVAVELQKPLRQAASQFELPDDFLPLLCVLELGHRCGDPQSYDHLRRLWPRLASIRQAEARRSLVDRSLKEEWKSLHPLLLVRKDGDLRLPSDWAPDVAGLLLASDLLAGKLNLATVLLLSSLLKDGKAENWARLAARIDGLLTADDPDVASTVAELLSGGGWSGWRLRTRLKPELLHSAALAWLSSPVWRSGAPPVPIEDWDQVISDIEESPLTAAEMDSLFMDSGPASTRRDAGTPGCWPWILPFQLQQVEDLARISSDWDALATLRERLSPQSIPYRLSQPLSVVLQRSFDFPAQLPDNFLDSLIAPSDSQPQDRPWSLVLPIQALKALFPAQGRPARLGGRAELLRTRLQQGTAEMLEDESRIQPALQTARFLKLEQHQAFVKELAKVLNDRALKAESGASADLRSQELNLLEDWLASFPPLPEEQQSEQAARYFLSKGKKRVAGFLCPDVTERKTILQSLDCLMEGRSEHPCWDQLARSRENQPPHPAAEMARILRRRSRGLSQSQRRALIRHGWSTFLSAAQGHPAWTSDQQSGQATVLPVLQLAAVLQPQRGLGSLAAEIVELAWQNPRIRDLRWWMELVRGLEGCPRLDGLPSADDWPEAAYAVLRTSVLRYAVSNAERSVVCSNRLDSAWQQLEEVASERV